MGRRSRKRRSAGEALEPEAPPVAAQPRAAGPRPAAEARAATPRRTGRPTIDERPRAPWAPFPLVELCILIALVLGILGFIIWGERGQIMVACAAALGSLAGLELSIREHWAGYRSHSSVLALAIAVVAIAVMFFAGLPQEVMLAVGAAIFATAFYAFREVFRRRSGGLGFR